MKNLPLRDCVVGVFVEGEKVLVGERFKCAGEWQFPQGGVEKAESHDEAILREAFEELGNNSFEVMQKSSGTTTYLFPKGLNSSIIQRFSGQTQVWYKMRFINGAKPALDLAQDQEFRDLKWVTPREAIDSVVDWKKQAYIDGLSMLGLITNY